MRASVDLPEPDSPTSASVSPRPIENDTAFTAVSRRRTARQLQKQAAQTAQKGIQ